MDNRREMCASVPQSPGLRSRRSRRLTYDWSKSSKAASRYRIEFRLSVGQGYAVQNGRWLHGRGRFSGNREMLRILGHPLSGIPIRYGFTAGVNAEATGAVA